MTAKCVPVLRSSSTGSEGGGQVPCETCVKRGCSAICPEGACSYLALGRPVSRPCAGSLTTGNKTNRCVAVSSITAVVSWVFRLAFADAEELQKKIERLRSRVGELEAALEKLQAAVSDEPHPLLLNAFETINASSAPTLPRRADSQPSVSREEDDFVDAFGTSL